MENFICSDLQFEDKELNELCKCLVSCYGNNQYTFAKTCFSIYNIWSYCKSNYFKAKNNEYYNSYKLLAKFGFDRKSVSRYKSCYEKFIQGTTIENVAVKTYFYGFSPSKLFELLPLSYETLENAIDKHFITPDMTVKQIREYVKQMVGEDATDKVVEQTVEEINEDEIPDAYDPNKKYEFSYFENKSKSQLLNIVMTLQTAYQKLKNKGEKQK